MPCRRHLPSVPSVPSFVPVPRGAPKPAPRPAPAAQLALPAPRTDRLPSRGSSISQDVLGQGINGPGQQGAEQHLSSDSTSGSRAHQKLIREQLDVPRAIKIEARNGDPWPTRPQVAEALGVQWVGAAAGTSGRANTLSVRASSPRTDRTGHRTSGITPSNPNSRLVLVLRCLRKPVLGYWRQTHL